MTTQTSRQVAARQKDTASFRVIPLDRTGQPLPEIEIEITAFWYLDCLSLELIGPCRLGNGKLAVQMRTADQDVFLTGRDYWRLLHGARRATAEDAGILEARLHQVARPPAFQIVADPESLWGKREPVPRPERRPR